MTFLFFVLLFPPLSIGQVKGRLQLSDPQSIHELYVEFNTDLDFGADAVTENVLRLIPQLQAIHQQYNFSLERGIAISNSKLDEMERNAMKFTGNSNSIQKLRNTFRVKISNPDNQELLALAQQLEMLDDVTSCDLFSLKSIPPPGDIMPVTPNFENSQTYLNPNPGVNMKYAWDMNLNGNGIRVRDVEYGFNKNHEEFNDREGAMVAEGMNIGSTVPSSWVDHGTAVFGIVYADKGSYGVSGMANDAAEMHLFPQVQESGSNTMFAISQSIEESAPGDVIIFEMQAYGQSDNYVPVEYYLTAWNLTKAATDAGITIVAAAANGNQNLDSPFYAGYINRGDSGAIIVGAGTPDLNHDKISYSTYGSRVDVQAWGSNVYATGYGTSALVGSDFNQGYGLFSGTSSATPIVASCAVVLQSYYHSITGNYLTSVQLRNILKTTGIPQGSGGNIGPMPDMPAAIEAINLLNINEATTFNFAVYPNPAVDKVTVYGRNFSTNAKVEIVNALGQTISNSFLPEDAAIDVSSLSKGFYFVRLIDNGRTSVRKIIRN